MSRRKRKEADRGQIAAGAPQPAPPANAPNSGGGGPGNPSPSGITQTGWIIIGVVLVGLGIAAFLYFQNNGDGGPQGGPGDKGDPSDPANPRVVMETSMGTMKLELYKNRAPVTVENFLKYVDDKHYDGTIFHRVMPDFMIQGGGFEQPGRDMKQRGAKQDPIKNEAGNGLSNLRGTVAMARTDDPDSATDQFFINLFDKNREGLDRRGKNAGYAVFGKVIEGMEVADKIKFVDTTTRKGHRNVPVDDVIIKSIRRVESK